MTAKPARAAAPRGGALSAKSVAALRREIRSRLEDASEARVREGLAIVCPGAEVIGVRVPKLRALAAAFRKERPDLGLDAALELADAQWATRVRDEILFAIFFVARFGRAMRDVPWVRIERWLDAIDNWETCDQLANNVAAAIVDAHPELETRVLKLAASRNVWRRRFTLALASSLNHAGRRHPAFALAAAEALFFDDAPIVRKAVGWAVREACRHDADGAYRLLAKHAARLHPTVLREAGEKLSAAQRAELLRRREGAKR